MTFKFVGALRGLGHLAGYQTKALGIGFALGFLIQIVRKGLWSSARWRAYIAAPGVGFAVGWIVDALVLSSPYASSFGGFVDLSTSTWMAIGGVVASLLATLGARRRSAAADALPEDMSTNSLLGGGLIAGESLYTLVAGIVSLLALLG
jgi:hypothetical protein